VSVSETTRIGTVFAGYRVESLLGRGGMSVVYLAEHVRLGRKVALKVLASPIAHDESYRERFVRESQRAADLDHPNVIPIYDAGEIEDGDSEGLLYIAMRYVAGSDLRALLKRDGQLSVGRTMFMLEQVAAALDAAHDKDLIHRDVKPSNILVAEPSEHVYLTDFGVAKHTTAPDLTQTGMFIGTVEYSAPEQIEGLGLDGRTDVYALACVLYECLAGRPPLDRDAVVGVMHAHLSTPPPRLTDARPDLPKELDRVITRGMAKARDDRYQTASDLLNAAHMAVLQRRAPVTQPFEEPVEESVAEEGPPSAAAAVTPPAEPPAAPEPAPVAPTPAAAGLAADGHVSPPADVDAGTAPAAPAEPPRSGRLGQPSWIATALLVSIAAVAAAAVAYFVARGDSPSSASPAITSAVNPDVTLENLVPQQLWKDCAEQNQAAAGALETAVCAQPPGGDGKTPDRWQISTYPDARSLSAAYTAARTAAGVASSGGRCDGTRWGGAGPWVHPGDPPKPGGERFCYFDGDDAVIVWTHERLGQPDHRDMLATAREGGTNHAGLFDWWRFWHHRIGKTGT
jgi:serine/threonine-protein kinase